MEYVLNPVNYFISIILSFSGLIQMMASAACSRDLVYFTFGDAVSSSQVYSAFFSGLYIISQACERSRRGQAIRNFCGCAKEYPGYQRFPRGTNSVWGLKLLSLNINL